MLCVLKTQNIQFDNKKATQYFYETTSFHLYECIFPKKKETFSISNLSCSMDPTTPDAVCIVCSNDFMQ